MHYFNYRNDKLFCEDVEVKALAEEFGTPLYVYSKRTLIEHFEKIKEAFSGVDSLVCYSVKANSSLSLLNVLVSRGCGLDIVSGGELNRAKLVNCPAKKIVYASVGKTEGEIRDAIKYGILLFNVESLPELERINKVAASLKRIQDVALRVNPDVDAHTHKYITTAKKETKFGIDLAGAQKIFLEAKRKYKNINLNGIHIHIGSQIIEAKPFVKAVKKVLSLVDQINSAGINLEYFDIGGGLGIIYDEERPQTAKDFAASILPLIKKRDFKIILEPGRFIAGNAGILAAKVLYIKESYRKQFVIVDAAMNDLIRPSLYNAYHKIVNLSRPPQVLGRRSQIKDRKLVDVVGPICESGDFLGKSRILDAVAGDYIAVMSAGAYGFSMSSNYNSRPRPAEVLVDGSKYYLIREREDYKDLVRKEKIIKI